MPNETPVQMLEKANAELGTVKTELAALKTDATAKAESIRALTAERDTFKAQAVESAAKLTALETEKAALAQSLKDAQGKLESAEAKLKDPALLAAAAGTRPDPVAGLAAGEGVTPPPSKEEQAKAINDKIKATSDPKEKAVLRAELSKLDK